MLPFIKVLDKFFHGDKFFYKSYRHRTGMITRSCRFFIH